MSRPSTAFAGPLLLTALIIAAGVGCAAEEDIITTPPPDFASLTVLAPEDLPEGFVVIPPDEFDYSEAGLEIAREMSPASTFGLWRLERRQDFEIIYGYAGWISSANYRAKVALLLNDEAAFQEAFVKGLEFDEMGAPVALTAEAGELSRAVGVDAVLDNEIYFIETVGFLRGNVYVSIYNMYHLGGSPGVSLGEIASAADRRIQAFVGE